ncbi:MAG: 23S rRNA (adenine(2030)-N(6))-methyltransferase RlmJ [Candidatus Accumulibacter phosphatis]|uniref:23S rRNA (adenine(2030)-N(6))-methyltransferase RlmJ n=1 Tax=Candidatus Accumulibacter phosphatis TaxID=327160 RepID=UPI001A365274|nr:23S rRNA (adenine(2030)-N(6))-methyltransferase RlmJ [Candidatus Accumulibacter phosphatis]
MLSYRHGFHAGNHADVIKHVLLVQLTRYLGQKDKPFWFIDTHAGAGRYALDSAQASKLAEHREGIGRLWQRRDLPAAVAEYVELVRRFNPDGRLLIYPGSPALALATLRADDRLRLYELHSRDALRLRENFAAQAKQVIVEAADGFSALKALLPPPPRRALVLIDPAYEEKRDYERVVLALKDSLARFPGGTYLLWYPRLTRLEAHELPQRLKRLPAKSWLHVTLQVRKPAADGFGMHGSGLFVINPAWTLLATLQEVMPFLVQALGVDEGAAFSLESQEP